MADSPDLNPKPAVNPAAVDAPAPKSKSAVGSWPGVFNVFGEVFEQAKKNPEPAYVFIGVYAVLALLSFVTGGYASPFDTNSQDGGFEALAFLIFLLALPVYALALADRKVIDTSEFMRFDLGRYLTVFGIMLLTVLLVVIAAIPLLIPLIWVIPWLSLGSYIAVDRKLGVIESLKESKRLTQDHKGKVWGLIGVTILLTIAAGLLSFIPVVGAAASAAITVLSAGSFAVLYRWLQKNVTAA
jgi:hypothetical protein